MPCDVFQFGPKKHVARGWIGDVAVGSYEESWSSKCPAFDGFPGGNYQLFFGVGFIYRIHPVGHFRFRNTLQFPTRITQHIQIVQIYAFHKHLVEQNTCQRLSPFRFRRISHRGQQSHGCHRPGRKGGWELER